MTYFTALETLLSMFSAAVFGLIFSVLDIILKILTVEMRHVMNIKEHLFSKSNIFKIPKKKEETVFKGSGGRLFGEVGAFLKCVIFVIGFILLSYYALDGAIRLYLLVSAVFFFYVLRGVCNKTLFRIMDSIFVFLYGLIIVLMRIAMLPFMYTIKALNKRISKKADK